MAKRRKVVNREVIDPVNYRIENILFYIVYIIWYSVGPKSLVSLRNIQCPK